MTSATLLRLMARRWWVILIGLCLTAGVFAALQRDGGAYATDATVIFIAPGDRGVGEVNDGYLGSLVNFTAVIEREFHNGRQSDRLAENASLYSAGVTKGYRVLLVNSGSQWENSFAKPALTISVVGPSEEWVTSTLDAVTVRIASLAAAQQAKANVDPLHTITTERVPAAAAVRQLGGSRGTQARGLLALAIVGLGLSITTAVIVDHSITRSRARAIRRIRPAKRTGTGARSSAPNQSISRQKEGSTP